MTHSADMRPHLTDARRTANQTYQRRRARSAVDMLLDIPPDTWDEHTRRVILVTLPSLIYARELARYGEPLPPLTCPLSTCTQDAGHDGQHDPFPAPLRAAWCDYADETGCCTLPEGHAGDHDIDPAAALPDTDIRGALAADLKRMGLWPSRPDRELETVWCEAHGGTARPHFERGDCIHPHYTDQQTRARLNRELRSEPILHDNGDYRA